ncbi:MAG: glycosyltransferase [Deltaproteobacteria bacterium]|nr:glycosyltransferase [Deltaproteobacteria bacterium]
MAPIRILHIITSTDAGGSEMMLEKLCCRMRRDRFQQTVLSLKRVGSVGRRLQDTGVPVHSLGLSGVVINPRAFLEAVKLVRLLRPHIIQTWLYHADFFGLLISWVVPGVRMVWNIRCAQMELSHYPFHTRLTRWSCRWLSRHADAILTNSIAARDYHFSLGYTRYKWVVIENGFDLDVFRPDESAKYVLSERLGVEVDGPLIGMIARFDPMKDHRTFVQTAAKVLEKEPEAHFLLAGRGCEPENRVLLRMLPAHLRSRFHLLGERQDLSLINAALDVAVLCSRGESFPNAVGEAMACGVPCVVSDVGDAARLVGETGIVVPARDPEAFSAGIMRILGLENGARRGLGLRARRRIQECFEIGAISRRYESFYSALMSLGTGPGARGNQALRGRNSREEPARGQPTFVLENR